MLLYQTFVCVICDDFFIPVFFSEKSITYSILFTFMTNVTLAVNYQLIMLMICFYNVGTKYLNLKLQLNNFNQVICL